jgi:uncharacterized membrane protein
MKTFISDASKETFPAHQMVNGNTIHPSVFSLIQKDYPAFNANCKLSLEELNAYRQKYIAAILQNEIGELSKLETTVLDSLQNQDSIINRVDDENISLSYGQKIADKVATFGGSWTFIISFGVFILIWIIINIIFLSNKAFDPYPFILLNLILSCLAAMQAPVIMMSQNRQEEKDRDRAKKDYMINLKAELEIKLLHEKIDHIIMHQQQELIEIQKVQIEMMNDIMTHIKK